ncbi:hypothetical protein EI94DRAFT_1698106 [Lactarius quietus]|nr:hypothetical protein EI94DRAFT_1698106 [Lactarius quietus]
MLPNLPQRLQCQRDQQRSTKQQLDKLRLGIQSIGLVMRAHHDHVSLLLLEGTVEQWVVSSRLSVDSEANRHNQLDDVWIPTPDGAGPEPVLHRVMGQSNGGPNPNTADPDIMPKQAVGPPLDVVSGGASTGTVLHHMENWHQDSVSNSSSAAEAVSHQVVGSPLGDVSTPTATSAKPMPQQEEGEDSDVHGAQVAPPSSSSSPLHISGQYMCSSQMLLFLLSTIVTLIAFLLQYESVQEMSHRGTGIIKPGWTHYRKEGLEGSSFKQ